MNNYNGHACCESCGCTKRASDVRAQRESTVKRATLFDGVIDTFRTETELNGWKPTQGRMAL